MSAKVTEKPGHVPVRSKDNFLVFGSPLIEEPEIQEVVDSLRSGWLGTGPKVANFEEAFRKYNGARYAVALNSCTAALHLSLLALGLEPGQEVITTPMTFCATVNAIIHAGAKPVLVDVDSKTGNLAPEAVEAAITSRTRALLPVHFAGQPCEMDSLAALAKKHGLVMVEDCAHAIEAEYKGRKMGRWGRVGCFSFYVTKNIVTGEGGMVVTDDEEVANRIKMLSLHGMTKDAWHRFGDEGYKHYLVMEAGYKYNMMDLQAAIGLHQLSRIERYWQRRREIWLRYQEELKGLPLNLPNEPPAHIKHSYHLYTVLVEPEAGLSRDQVLNDLTAQNIGVGVHYLSIPEHPYYQQRFGWRPEDFPTAMDIGRRTLSLPLSAKLTDRDVDDVIKAVKVVLDA